MTVELLTEHCLEFLSLTGGCTGSSESTLVKMSNCWKSRAAAPIYSEHTIDGIFNGHGPLALSFLLNEVGLGSIAYDDK